MIDIARNVNKVPITELGVINKVDKTVFRSGRAYGLHWQIRLLSLTR